MRVHKISKVNIFLGSIIMITLLLSCSSQVQADWDLNYSYTVTAGKVQITGYAGAAGDITIPSTLGGLPVTSIGNRAFFDSQNLTSISIPQEVTSIGDSAFYGCSSLTSINIPQGVTSIGNGTFANCKGLTSINIPQEITSIGGSAFFNCKGLTSINIPQGVTSIGDSAFAFCENLTSINIPQGITRIGECTFYSCKSLTSIVIPQRVTSIGKGAFFFCNGLTTITINSATTMINDSFNTIPAQTKIIGNDTSYAKEYAIKYNNPFEAIIADSVPINASVAVTTLTGSNNYGTSLEIAKQFVKKEGSLDYLVIASGSNWPDALSGGSLAGEVNSPMLMIPKNILDATKQLDFITNNVNGGGTIYILGGTSVVSSDYEDILTSKGFINKIDDLSNFTIERNLDGFVVEGRSYILKSSRKYQTYLNMQESTGRLSTP